MPVVWIDPFIAGAVALSDTTILGDGTDTVNYNTAASRTGTYLNPFRFDDWQSNSSGATTVNGVTIAADTEVRIKGKTMADLTTNLGAMYASASYEYIYPEASNTTYATVAGGSTVYNNWLYLSGSNIDDLYPDVSGIVKFPLILPFPTSATSASMRIGHQTGNNDGRALYNAIRDAGYTKYNQTGVSGNFCDLAFIKNGYLQQHELSGADKYHWFSTGGRVTSCNAGWTSETEQGGYSMVSLNQNDSYERQYFRGTNCLFDWSRLFIRLNGRRIYWRFQPIKSGSGVHHKIGQWHQSRSDHGENLIYNTVASTIEVGNYTGYGPRANANNASSITQVNLTICQSNTLRIGENSNGNNRSKIGSIYINASGITANQRGFIRADGGLPTYTEFMNGSSYYSRLTSGVTAGLNGSRDDQSFTSTTYVYPTNLYRAGESGHWLSNIPAATAVSRNPTIGVFKASALNTAPFTDNLSLTAANWWEIYGLFQESTFSKLPIKDMGYLACGGSNYKTTSNQISTVGGITLSTSSTTFPPNYACETNDYDNKPLIVMADTLGSAPSAALAYNETLNDNEVVVLQNGGSSGGAYSYGLELQVPTDFDPTSENVRVKLFLSRTTNATINVGAYYYYRNDTSTSSHFHNIAYTAISSNQAGPTSITYNLTTPASGLRIINSVLVYLVFTTATTSVTEKLYIHDAIIETY